MATRAASGFLRSVSHFAKASRRPVLCFGNSSPRAAYVSLGSANPAALEIHNNTEVRLDQKNFLVVKPNVIGQCSGFSLFGLVTIVPAKFTKAMSRLYAQADMQPGSSRMLANLIMEKNSTYLILFSIPHTSIRADVVEFTAPPLPTDQKDQAPAPAADSGPN